MLRYLGLTFQYPFLRTVGEIYYYGIIAIAGLIFLFLAARKWASLGYPKKRAVTFSAIFIAAAGPLVYVGSRAVGMFYKPMSQWSLELLAESILHGSTHTFHGALILPTVFMVVLALLYRFRASEILDAAFLYVPILHAFGRSACLIVGCCWGRYVHLNFFWLSFGFQNPAPLWAILVNVGIFLVLRKLYGRIYAPHHAEVTLSNGASRGGGSIRKRFSGSVFASYCILYAPARIVFEVFRTERKVFHGLTQAQVTMGIILLIGVLVKLTVAYRCYRNRLHSDVQKDPALINLLSMVGMLASLVFLSFVIFYLTRQLRVWPWPIQPVVSLADAYFRILYYLPMMLIPAYCLYWLYALREPIRPWFQWQQFSYIILIGLGISAFYSFDLLVLRDISIRGAAFWPPVLVLGILNAVAEEVIYRLGLYRVIRRSSFSRVTANIVQALVYSLIHFMIAGPMFGIYAFVYGLIMGLIVIRSRSLLPAILCHFIIDLGAIGMPLLRY